MMQEKIIELRNKLDDANKVDINNIDIETIPDIKDIKISRKKVIEERILDFIDNIDNPYLFKVDNILVKVEFGENNTSAEESLINVLSNLYK